MNPLLTYLAKILICEPEIGCALVMPLNDDKQRGPLVATLPASDSGVGVATQPAYVYGATVVCADVYEGSEFITCIISVVNNNIDRKEWNTTQSALYNAEGFTQSNYDARAFWEIHNIFRQNGAANWLRNHRNGADGDTLPGDFDMIDKTGLAGLHIGRTVAQLRGSPMAFVDAVSEGHKVRLVGNSVSTNTITGENERTSDYAVDNIAISAGEAFGVSGNKPVVDLTQDPRFPKDKAIPDTFKDVYPDALPLYRLQSVAGMLADGKESIVSDFPKGEETDNALYHSIDNPPAILSRVRQSLSGELSAASAVGLNAVKSPFIPAVQQLGYERESIQGTAIEDLREPYKEPQKEVKLQDTKNVPLEDQVTDAALNKLIDTLLEGDYRQRLLDIMATKGFSVADKSSSISSKIKKKTVIGGTTNAQEYPLPDSITLQDPVTGESKTYYNSLSFITQEPDGSICIADGYGSEIRMCRGNIYISSALDLQLRPGRDLSAMAGRYQSYNSQDACTINSSREMYIRSCDNLKVTGGTEKGIVTIEGGSRLNSPTLGGVNIHSNTGLALTAANDLYIGRTDAETVAERTITEPATPGTVIIDAGMKNGRMYLQGGLETTVDSYVLNLCGITRPSEANPERRGSALIISQGTIYAMTEQLVAPATVLVEPLESMPSISVMSATAELTEALLNSADQTSCNIRVANRVDVGAMLTISGMGNGKGNLRVDGAIMARTVTATSDIGVQVPIETEYPVSAGDSEEQVVEKHDQYWIDPSYTFDLLIPAPTGLGINAENGVQQARDTVYQDKFVLGNKFHFPVYADVEIDRMPGMRWQDPVEKLSGDAQQGVWMEQYIKDTEGMDTAVYPGVATWEDARITGREHTLAMLKTGYRINARKKETR